MVHVFIVHPMLNLRQLLRLSSQVISLISWVSFWSRITPYGYFVSEEAMNQLDALLDVLRQCSLFFLRFKSFSFYYLKFKCECSAVGLLKLLLSNYLFLATTLSMVNCVQPNTYLNIIGIYSLAQPFPITSNDALMSSLDVFTI